VNSETIEDRRQKTGDECKAFSGKGIAKREETEDGRQKPVDGE
jgi:hypothetical protein